VLNGALASDALVVVLPAGVKLQQPLQVLHVSTAASSSSGGNCGVQQLAASAARLLISLGASSSAEVIEEFVADTAAASSGAYLGMPVAEVALGVGAELKHGYVQREAAGAQHFKATLVSQVCVCGAQLDGGQSQSPARQRGGLPLTAPCWLHTHLLLAHRRLRAAAMSSLRRALVAA
jgi:hypothetical protein